MGNGPTEHNTILFVDEARTPKLSARRKRFRSANPLSRYIFERTVMGQRRQLDVGFVGDID